MEMTSRTLTLVFATAENVEVKVTISALNESIDTTNIKEAGEFIATSGALAYTPAGPDEPQVPVTKFTRAYYTMLQKDKVNFAE